MPHWPWILGSGLRGCALRRMRKNHDSGNGDANPPAGFFNLSHCKVRKRFVLLLDGYSKPFPQLELYGPKNGPVHEVLHAFCTDAV